MISTLYITWVYFFTLLLVLASYLKTKLSFTMGAGFFSAWVFILGGSHELVYGKTSFSIGMGAACVLGGVYLNQCYLKLCKINQEWKALEASSKILGRIREEKLKKMFWDLRN